MTTEASVDVDRDAWPYRMKDLCELTGLPRQVIHFYIQQGLLPEGRKTGRNMAYYREEHLARLKLIRELQHERFLPLKAIRAIFDQQEGAFSPSQRQLLADVKTRLASQLAGEKKAARLDAREVLTRNGLTRAELDQMAEVGVLGVSEDEQGHPLIAQDDAWMLELWGEMKALGFTPEYGFSPRDLAMFEEAISSLFQKEAEMLTDRLQHVAPERVAHMVERALPLINTFLARYHTTKLRNFFAAM